MAITESRREPLFPEPARLGIPLAIAALELHLSITTLADLPGVCVGVAGGRLEAVQDEGWRDGSPPPNRLCIIKDVMIHTDS